MVEDDGGNYCDAWSRLEVPPSASTPAGKAQEPPEDGGCFTDVTRDALLNDARPPPFGSLTAIPIVSSLGNSRGTATGKGDEE